MDAAFKRYRFMAFTTGVSLLLLTGAYVLNQVDLAEWHRLHVLVAIVGIGHGVVLYPIYFCLCFVFALRARAPLYLLVAMVAAGFVPGLAFYVEHVVAKRYGYLRGPAAAPATEEVAHG